MNCSKIMMIFIIIHFLQTESIIPFYSAFTKSYNNVHLHVSKISPTFSTTSHGEQNKSRNNMLYSSSSTQDVYKILLLLFE